MKLIQTESDASISDMDTARICGDALYKHYPKHLWAIDCSWKTGVMNIKCLDLSGKYGYVIKLLPLATSSELEAKAVKAGGEILERYRLTRGEWRPDEVLNLPTSALGQILGDLS